MHADWIDLFKFFHGHGVRSLVVSGVAFAFHGFERYTKVIDIWIEPNRDNAKAVLGSLKAFGGP